MDPNATLALIFDCQDYDDACAHWQDYLDWRSRGGFAADPDIERNAADHIDELEQRITVGWREDFHADI